jgi:hypothetical protein
MLADTGAYGYTTVIWAGRDNYSSQSQVLADVASMVGALTSNPKTFVVLSVINGEYPSEAAGGASYAQIASLNAALQAAYPNNFLDVRTPLVNSYNPALTQDAYDFANSVPPWSMRGTIYWGSLSAAITSTTATSFSASVAGTALAPNVVLTIDSESILVSAVSGGNITNCVRGWGGTTAATHLISANYLGVDPIHLSQPGYLVVARKVREWLCAHYGCTAPQFR